VKSQHALAQGAITTSSSGAYEFTQVPTGSYTVSFELQGNRPNPPSVSIEVTSGAPTVIAPVAAGPTLQLIYLPSVNGKQK
jgi:hypothetical protein